MKANTKEGTKKQNNNNKTGKFKSAYKELGLSLKCSKFRKKLLNSCSKTFTLIFIFSTSCCLFAHKRTLFHCSMTPEHLIAHFDNLQPPFII